jgi:pyruvate/oxaloacetate carboxyltransferase
MPYDSVCFKDASGTARPQKVYETIRCARKLLGAKTKLVFHSHDTAGTCVLAYKAAIEAGADQIDLALAPVSGGTSQPDVITMWHALRGTDYTLDIDIEKIIRLSEMFKERDEGLLHAAGSHQGRARHPLLPHAGRRAHRQYPDAARQQVDGQVSRR